MMLTPDITTYDFDRKDYEFEQVGMNVTIREREKNRAKTNKTYQTIDKLEDILTETAGIGLTSESQNNIRIFLENFQQKLIRKLESIYPNCIVSLIFLFQKVLGIGPLVKIQDLKRKFSELPPSQKPLVSIHTRRKSYDELLCHRALIEKIKVTPLTEKDLREKVQDILSQDENFFFLESALENGLTDASALLFKDAIQVILKKEQNETFDRILKRFDQLLNVTFETKPLTSKELFHIAFFIEARITKIKKVANSFFKAENFRLPRSIQIDIKTKDIYILADQRYSLLQVPQKDSTFKQVFSSLRVPRDDLQAKPTVVASLITRLDTLIDDQIDDLSLEDIEVDMQNIKREIAFCKKFNHSPGFPKFITAMKFSEVADVGEVERMNLVFEKADGNLSERVLESEVPLSFSEKLTSAKELISAIQTLHSQNIIHGDIKLPNALYVLNGSQVLIRVMLCDFGCAFVFNQNKPEKTKTPEVYGWGHAGTKSFSSPELYGTCNFRGDYFKVDTWALGCLLYSVHFGKKTPWQALIDDTSKKYFDESEKEWTDTAKLNEAKKAFRKMVVEEIEKPLSVLSTKANLYHARSQTEGFEPHLSPAFSRQLFSSTCESMPKKADEKNPGKSAAQNPQFVTAHGITDEEKFTLLVFNLLRLDPAKRFSIDQAAIYLGL